MMQDLSKDEWDLLHAVPADGTPIGNVSVRAALSWSEARYWQVRDELIDKGLLSRGKGRGGAVIKTQSGNGIASKAPEDFGKESALYEPICSVLRDSWARERRVRPLAVEITAFKGKKHGLGKWTVPDLVSLELRRFSFVPGIHLEVVTFEVKSWQAILTQGVQAVYEALAHRRAATRSYVWLHIPDASHPPTRDTLESVCSVAGQHGIGVITAVDPDDFSSWEEIHAPQQHNPDPDDLDAFLRLKLSDEAKASLEHALAKG